MFSWVEIVGYVASVLVAVSLTMSSVIKLRFLNLLGAIVFAVYGYMVGAYPVIVVNAFMALVNIVYLFKLQSQDGGALELLALEHPDNPVLIRFLEFHREDISQLYPRFQRDDLPGSQVVFVMRKMLPVALVICRRTDEQTFTVVLDYAVASGRDFQCGQLFFQSWADVIDDQDIRRFVAQGRSKNHRRYLKKMGFLPDPDRGSDMYVRPV